MSRFYDRDRWGEVLQALYAKPMRTIITAFGVCWGIFILVLLLSASNGLENGVKKGFDGVAVNSIVVLGGNTSLPYKGYKEGRRIQMKNEDVAFLRNSIQGIKYLSTGSWGEMGSVQKGAEKGEYSIKGESPNAIKQLPYKMLKGRFINQNDFDERTKIAVVGVDLVKELFSFDEDPIGQFITVNNVGFHIVGVYTDNTRWGNKRTVLMPFSTYQQIHNLGDSVPSMFITADDSHTGTEIETEAQKLLKKKYNVHPDDENAFWGWNLYEFYKQTSDLFNVLALVSYFVGILILLSGIIGITNIMLIVVKERTKEIGIRRAIGATPKAIVVQLMTESIVLTLLAGMVGVILSTGVVVLVNQILDTIPDKEDLFFTNPTVNVGTIGVAFFILVTSGLIAGYIPARTAIKIKPIDALRDE